MVSSRGAHVETLWMSDKQGLVSVTMVNKPESSISRIEREEETATYSVGTTLRILHMRNRQKQRQKKTRKSTKHM